MDFGDIKHRAQQRFRDPTGLLIGDTTWSAHVNAAYREFLRAARWPFLVDTQDYSVTAGTRLMDLSVGLNPPLTAEQILSGLENVMDTTNNGNLNPVPVVNLPWRLRIYLDRQEPGLPALYAVIGKNLYLIPPPKADVTLKVFWFHDPVDMVNDTDVPVLPARYQEGLVTGALAKASRDDQNFPAADKYDMEFKSIIAQAVQELVPGQTELANYAAAQGTPLAAQGLSNDNR
jgi:hypothetical protein